MTPACVARQLPSLLTGRTPASRWAFPRPPSTLQSLDDLFLTFLRKPCAFRAVHLQCRQDGLTKPSPKHCAPFSSILSQVSPPRSLSTNSHQLLSTQSLHPQIRWKSTRASKKALNASKTSVPAVIEPSKDSSKKKSRDIAELGGISEDQYQKSRHRFRPLSSEELAKIFGGPMEGDLGNYLLDTIQKQRMTGTLDAGINGPGISEYLIETALAWLRHNYPLDEDEATFRRFRREDRLEAARWMTVGHDTGNWTPQAGADPENPAGKSRLEKLRERNIAAREERERIEQAQAEERAMTLKDQGISVPAVINPKNMAALERDLETEKRRAETAEWTKKYRERGMISQDREPPKMSKAQRIVPSVLWAACVIVLCWVFASAYEEPGRNGRLFPNIPMSAATIGTIMLINIAAFMFWRYPPAYRFMNLYFLVVPGLPRVSAQLGSFFSHQQPSHLFWNMLLLWFVGTQVHEMVGRGNFLALYIGAGVFGAAGATTLYVLTNRLTVSVLGASTAVCALIAAGCLLKGDVSLPVDFIPPEWNHFNLRWIFLWLFLSELLALRKPQAKIDVFGHLAGYVAGAIGALYIKRKNEAAAKQRVVTSPVAGQQALKK